MNEEVARSIANFLNETKIASKVKIYLKDEKKGILEGILDVNFIRVQQADEDGTKFAVNLRSVKWEKYGYADKNETMFYIVSELIELNNAICDTKYYASSSWYNREIIPSLKVYMTLLFEIKDDLVVTYKDRGKIVLVEEDNMSNRVDWKYLDIKFIEGEHVYTKNGSMTKAIR